MGNLYEFLIRDIRDGQGADKRNKVVSISEAQTSRTRPRTGRPDHHLDATQNTASLSRTLKKSARPARKDEDCIGKAPHTVTGECC
jgi:hypothetical protein